MSNTEKVKVQFVDLEGSNLFSAQVACLPRIGETVIFCLMAVAEEDVKSYTEQRWEELRKITGKKFEVQRVEHCFYQYNAWRNVNSATTVYLKPLD